MQYDIHMYLYKYRNNLIGFALKFKLCKSLYGAWKISTQHILVICLFLLICQHSPNPHTPPNFNLFSWSSNLIFF